MTINKTKTLNRFLYVILLVILCHHCQHLGGALGQQQQARAIRSHYVPVKFLGFTDSNTSYFYKVVSFNVTQMTADSTIRSIIKVSRIKIDDRNLASGQPEFVQTIKFHPTLVDFDLQCERAYCCLVALTSRSKRNIELFVWQRTQFDIQAVRDSFARPQAVKLFQINSGFYIAVAQEQLHISSSKLFQDYEEQVRFIGCAILKFTRGNEQHVKYHQFIRLPFNPNYIHYFKSINANNVSANAIIRPSENHYIVFSVHPDWTQSDPNQVNSYMWSPLNDYFWPYRFPRGVEVPPRPIQGPTNTLIKLPGEIPKANLTQPSDYIGPVESCFYQLQRLLADRELHAKKLIDSSRSIWQANQAEAFSRNLMLTNISSRVYVHGNVIVRGSLIESPQMSLIGGRPAQIPHHLLRDEISQLVDSHSPAIVENKIRQAQAKLTIVRNKLAQAVPANLPGPSNFNSQVRFLGSVFADSIIFGGVANSDVRLNGIPFRQLEHELVTLNGAQDIGAKVRFTGKVTADLLEIHGLVNDFHYMRDAIDIANGRIQVIDTDELSYGQPNAASLDFASIGTPGVILAPNSSINGIQLHDFITRDNRTQVIYGKKTFNHLSMAKLDLAHSNVLLNGVNISHLVTHAIRLRNPDGNHLHQALTGNHIHFAKRIHANRLKVNGIINNYINLSSLIFDSVKTSDVGIQKISGHKNFLNGLSVARLTTDGAINGIQVNEIFNLNALPPLSDYIRYANSSLLANQVHIHGDFVLNAPVTIHGNLNSALVNGVDITKRAIRRGAINYQNNASQPQIVHGRKVFTRALRVVDKVRLMDNQLMSALNLNAPEIRYPSINDRDLRLINQGLERQRQRPPLIYIDNLDIDGNLNLPHYWNATGPSRVTLGNYSTCPLDVIRSRLVLAGHEEQLLDVPIRVNTLRARSVQLNDRALNGLSFPNDFVLRSSSFHPQLIQPVYGRKTFDHLVITPSSSRPGLYQNKGNQIIPPPLEQFRRVSIDRSTSINGVNYGELQTFLGHEQRHNSTGEKFFNTLNVHGNLRATRINGYYWPDDILLKSASSHPGPTGFHKRLYSPLVFLNSSDLHVINQLVLRGPIHLDGRMNGINLTEFAQQSATYGDKDLLSVSRPIRNKVFLGGLSVRSEMRSHGFIDGVNFEEMKNRVVKVGPSGGVVHIVGPKMFLSDVTFQGPISMMYLNDVPINHYLQNIQFQPDGATISVRGKKTISGTLRISKNLFVRGLINKINFADFKARAISLSPNVNELQFNKTLTVEGDAFIDNLLIDERNGTIDGVRLTNMLPIGNSAKDELILISPRISPTNNSYDPVTIHGSIQDCQITCTLQPTNMQNTMIRPYSPVEVSATLHAQQHRPQMLPPGPVFAHQIVSYPPRPILYHGQNITFMRTTPPYAIPSAFHPRPPLESSVRGFNHLHLTQVPNEAARVPVSITYEQNMPIKKYTPPRTSQIVVEQIEALRKQIVTFNLVKLSTSSGLVVGFIDAGSNDISGLQLPEEEAPHSDHVNYPKSFQLLDQTDFPFMPTIYHLSVGVTSDHRGSNFTKVLTSLGGSPLQQLSVLPIASPNSAMFLKAADTLFLLISQDHTDYAGDQARCPAEMSRLPSLTSNFYEYRKSTLLESGGIHVYLFHVFKNSSSLRSAYFDLYQTIDLPTIDSFDRFSYGSLHYALAVSRQAGRVYLLVLRGYSGFQVVSYIDAPSIDYVKVIYTVNQRPMLVINQSDGLYRLMESVVI